MGTIAQSTSTMGTAARKEARHETASASHPANTGPPKAASAQTMASTPNTLGIRREGNRRGMST